jgi:hypothetical protein
MRRVRIPTIVGSIVLLTVAAAPVSNAVQAADESPRGPQECAATLDCGLEEINLMSMSDRLDLVRAIEAGPVAEFLSDGTDPGRWRNIEGIITMFRNQSLGARGSWVSYVDAGIVEGVERGTAIATGRSTDTGGNPGSQPWADYLTQFKAGELDARAVHDRTWSIAEQAATDHGIAVAEDTYNEHPTATENRFFEISQFYRYLLRNRPPLIDLLTAVGNLAPGERQNFYDWATDVTNAEAGRTGAEFLWSMAELDPAGTAFTMIQVFQAYFQELYPLYVAETS